jgi:hypothetical protein
MTDDAVKLARSMAGAIVTGDVFGKSPPGRLGASFEIIDKLVTAVLEQHAELERLHAELERVLTRKISDAIDRDIAGVAGLREALRETLANWEAWLDPGTIDDRVRNRIAALRKEHGL